MKKDQKTIFVHAQTSEIKGHNEDHTIKSNLQSTTQEL